MKGAAFLVIAFSGGEVEALAHGKVVRKKIARNRFFLRRATGKYRHDIDDARAVIHPHEERIDLLQWHEQHQRERTRDSAQPTGAGYPPSDARAASKLRGAIRIPGFRLAEIFLDRGRADHGAFCTGRSAGVQRARPAD